MYVEPSPVTLSDFVDSLQERGQYTFSRNDALAAMGVSPVALKRAAERLKAKRRLATPRRGFYTIVPLEYRQSGAPPAASFIDQLMRFHDTPYYVGLLSAAELHEAAHQKPQEFQVFATEQLCPLNVGRNRIRFFLKKDLADTPVELVRPTAAGCAFRLQKRPRWTWSAFITALVRLAMSQLFWESWRRRLTPANSS